MSEELPNNDQSAPKNQADVEMTSTTEPNPDGFFADLNTAQACSVRVALRVRPLSTKEVQENSRVCVAVKDQQNQVTIGKDTFTFDQTFDMASSQEAVFESCVKNLVLGCFNGFNATVLAYGQTGSGKTFTMGSGFTFGVREQELGIIPRVIRLIFEEETNRRHKALFTIKCSFLEIYNEEIIDLLDSGLEKGNPQRKEISVREEKNGSISVYGLNEVTVRSRDEMASFLDIGSNARSTASTQMNMTSSRSHAIFTITIEQHPFEDTADEVSAPQIAKPTEFIVAKFHFVDLAGSERVKKTGATGSTLKEGININKSLLALGNVISALTDETKKIGHIPYRDSKLTRILQDSLGGNSRTSMIACCSPAESNYAETLSTLQYASRARNIKNKPVINRDPASQQIAELKVQIFELQKELIGSRQLLRNNGIPFQPVIELPTDINLEAPIIAKPTPLSHENNQVLEAIIKDLKQTLIQKDQQISSLQNQCTNLKLQTDQLQINQLDNLKQRDEAKLFAQQLRQRLSDLGQPVFQLESESNVLDEYRKQNVELDHQVQELRYMLQTLQVDNQSLISQGQKDTENLESQQIQIEKLKLQNQRLKLDFERLQRDLNHKNEIQRQPQFQQSIRNNKPVLSDIDTQNNENSLQPLIEQHIERYYENVGNLFIKHLGQQMISNLVISDAPSQPMQEQYQVDEQMIDDQLDQETPDQIEILTSDQIDQKLVVQEGKLLEQNQNLKHLETQVKDKEELLSDLQKSKMELQSQLLFAMKEEYHKKMEQLTNERMRLEQEKSQQLTKAQGAQRGRIEDQFKKKQQELELQIQQMAKKDRETKQMQKSLEEQQRRVKTLEQDIEKMKTQKVVMMKKSKDDADQLAKLKQERIKEIQMLKAQYLKKDKELVDYKREQGKNAIFAKRKAEEVQAMQQRQKIDQQKRQNAKQTRQLLKQVDFDQIKAWVLDNTQKMVEFYNLQQQREQKEAEFQDLDLEIDNLQQYLAKQIIAQQRLRISSDAFLETAEIRQLKEEIEILEKKRNFINGKIIELDRQLIETRPESQDTSIFENVSSIEGARACIEVCFQLLFKLSIQKNDAEKENVLFKRTFDELNVKIDQLMQLREATAKYHEHQLQELQSAHDHREQMWFNALAEKSGVDTSQIESQNLDQLLQLCFTKQPYYQLNFTNDALKRAAFAKNENREAVIEQSNLTKAALQQKISELQRKLTQQESVNQKLAIDNQHAQQDRQKYKKLYDDEKTKNRKQSFLVGDEIGQFVQSQVKNTESSSFIGSMRPLTTAKTVAVSYKDARNARKQKKAEEIVETPFTELVFEEEDVFNRLSQRSRAFTTKLQSRPESQLLESHEDQYPDNQKWSVLYENFDAHKSSVYSLTSLDQNLYSSSNKSIKIWDLNNMKQTQELNDGLGLAKTIKVCSERNILVATSEKSIMVWSLQDLKKIGEFRGHSEIKCLEFVGGETMFAGTQGSITTGGLLVFDLRKSFTQTVDEREKNQDIFCLKAANEWLFMGCRNHMVYPLDLKTRERLKPLVPPHFQAVTCLGTLQGNTLVSGGIDKNLRSFDIGNAYFEQKSSFTNAHNDTITSLDSLGEDGCVYSGSKDGVVKVWTQQEGSLGDLKCLAKLDGNASGSGVNAVCALNKQFGAAFATASDDKSIRIWSHSNQNNHRSADKALLDSVADETASGIGGGAFSLLRSHAQKRKQKTTPN